MTVSTFAKIRPKDIWPEKKKKKKYNFKYLNAQNEIRIFLEICRSLQEVSTNEECVCRAIKTKLRSFNLGALQS